MKTSLATRLAALFSAVCITFVIVGGAALLGHPEAGSPNAAAGQVASQPQLPAPGESGTTLHAAALR
jgi:hypothetical protein